MTSRALDGLVAGLIREISYVFSVAVLKLDCEIDGKANAAARKINKGYVHRSIYRLPGPWLHQRLTSFVAPPNAQRKVLETSLDFRIDFAHNTRCVCLYTRNNGRVNPVKGTVSLHEQL